jgi:hypothetical protein
MQRPRVLLGAGLGVLVGILIAVLAFPLFAPKPGITLENFHRLRQGMTLANINAILGVDKGGTWADGWVNVNTGTQIILTFDSGGRLIEGQAYARDIHGKYLEESLPKPGLLERFRTLLRW